MSAPRRSRTASQMLGSFAELKVKWQLWCEEEGVNDPPNLVKVDSVKRARHSVVPIVEQSPEEYVKLCSVDNQAEEAQRDSTTTILVQFENVEPFALKGVQVQGKLVSAPLSCAVGRIIEFYPSITTLKLIKCSLVAESIHLLGYLLQNSSVTHLYLDENAIAYQNYYLILENNEKLLHLSLRLNMINDCGAEYLGRSLQYKHPHHQILRSLNLNCNLIDDEGACALAKALRWNRNLTCLALAGNRIGDKGGIALARMFLPFQLTQQELEFRAELLCNRLLEVKTAMEESARNSKKATSKENIDEKGQPPEYPGESGDLNDVMLYYYNLEKWAEDKVPLVTNPIVSDVIETEDGNYLSKGNDALWYLNLSYNLITEDALLVFAEAFRHQESSIAEFDRKLWGFLYEGNPYDPDHPVIEELETYLNPHRSKMSLQGQGDGSRKGSKASLKSRKSVIEKKT